MKRQWRAGRVILAVLLLSLAGLAFYVWPIPPRWSIPCENFLGFNKEANVLFTYPVWHPEPVYALDSNDNKNTLELHGYGVTTGICELSKVFSFDISHVKPEFKNALRWVGMMSPDRQVLVGVEAWQPEIQVFEVATGWLRFRLEIETDLIIDATGFSPDSHFFYACARSPCRLFTWDLATGKLVSEIELDDALFGPGPGSHFESDRIQINADGTIAAIGGDVRGLLILDLKSKREIGSCDGKIASKFTEAGAGIVTLPRRVQDEGVEWYSFTDGVLTRRVNLPATLDGHFCGFCDRSIITAKAIPYTMPAFVRWIPDSIAQKLNSWLNFRNHSFLISLWSLNTGKLQQSLTLKMKGSIYFDYASEVRAIATDDVIAVNDGIDITLLDIAPRRSITCWLVCCSVAFLAFWLAWPRKIMLA